MKSDAMMTHFTPTGLAFDDGTELQADVIVFCTGFIGDAKADVVKVFGDELASNIHNYWGLDDEGELRGAFKPSGREFPLQVIMAEETVYRK